MYAFNNSLRYYCPLKESGAGQIVDWFISVLYQMQTWAIENFYSHTLLNYCPKWVGYSFESYVLRNQLIVLDHDHHVGWPVQKAND